MKLAATWQSVAPRQTSSHPQPTGPPTQSSGLPRRPPIDAICIMRLSAFALNALFVFNRGFRFSGISTISPALPTPFPVLFNGSLRGKVTYWDTDINGK